MLKGLVLFISLSFLAISAFAQVVDDSIVQGAEDYDWQDCVAKISEQCSLDCQKSPDVECDDNCNQLAMDKCEAVGRNPPQD